MRRTTDFVMSRSDSQHLLDVLGEVNVPRRHGMRLVVLLLIIATVLLTLLACRQWLG